MNAKLVLFIDNFALNAVGAVTVSALLYESVSDIDFNIMAIIYFVTFAAVDLVAAAVLIGLYAKAHLPWW